MKNVKMIIVVIIVVLVSYHDLSFLFAQVCIWYLKVFISCDKKSMKVFHNVVRCGIWYHLYNLKNLKNIHGGVLFLVTKSNSSMGVFHVFQIVPSHTKNHIWKGSKSQSGSRSNLIGHLLLHNNTNKTKLWCSKSWCVRIFDTSISAGMTFQNQAY